MNVLLDTNILARMAQPAHSHHLVAHAAVAGLVSRGDTPCLVPQVLYEFWVVATRPLAVNGLGLTPSQADAELSRVLGLYTFLPDNPAIYPEWRRLVTAHLVIGKNGHDARLVAAMLVHGLTHLLTFNIADFTRFSGITALSPSSLAPPATP
jgi:predicted nucleic acid-binding protein